MSLIRSLIRRRQFLFTFVGSIVSAVISLASWRITRVFELLTGTGPAAASETPAADGKKPLRGIVAYYSATGNTAQVAEALWRGMSSVIPCDVAPLKKLKPRDMAKYDVVAIGSPNWYMRVPVNVVFFTNEMPRMDGKHAILFGTHGSMPTGQFWFMSRNIVKKGLRIIGWSDWYGADFLTPHSCVPDGEWGHPDKIDLAEAEAFGRRMALNSKRIYAGETGLLPDRLPTPEIGSSTNNLMWKPEGQDTISFAAGVMNGFPRFDFTKCVYPRCMQCLENCPVKAIDFSVIAPAGSITDKFETASPVVLKAACQQCSGICERVCHYDAILYRSETELRSLPEIDMTKCTYPKCTICADECPQECIDLTKNPPVFYNRCEGESLCYGLCPENAIKATATSTGPGSGGEEGQDGSMGDEGMSMPDGAPGGGPGAFGPAGSMDSYGPRFRALVPGECTITVGDLTTYPRIPLNRKFWPYSVGK